jgi:hypothetical protein
MSKLEHRLTLPFGEWSDGSGRGRRGTGSVERP